MIPARVVFHPDSAYASLAQQRVVSNAWVVPRGPLLVVLVLACSISLLTRGYFAPGLIVSGMIAWCFVPLAEIAGLAVALRTARRKVPFPWAMDLFFAGHAPWFLWLFAFATHWLSIGPFESPGALWPWIVSLALVAIWSCYIDFFFFRHVAGAENPGRSLLVQRAISWAIFFAIFGGGPLWPGLLEELGIRFGTQ